MVCLAFEAYIYAETNESHHGVHIFTSIEYGLILVQHSAVLQFFNH